MADTGAHGVDNTAVQPAPNHLGNAIPSGNTSNTNEIHHEKREVAEEEEGGHDYAAAKPARAINDDDEEDEDMDALIDELESQDGQEEQEEEEAEGGDQPAVPEEMLNTSTRHGLSDAEVAIRRKRFGLNQMKEEKVNHFLNFLGYFVGPIQFVMEVSLDIVYQILFLSIDLPTLPVPPSSDGFRNFHRNRTSHLCQGRDHRGASMR